MSYLYAPMLLSRKPDTHLACEKCCCINSKNYCARKMHVM